MIQQKVFEMMNAAKEHIIKTMQERGIKKVNLVMTLEEWAKENGFGPDDDLDTYECDYDDYRNEEAPCVIFFNKWGNGMDYAAYSVELVDGPVEPRFKLECYNSEEGDEWFYDSDLDSLSMIDVYDAMEAELDLEDQPKQKVWVFYADQMADCDVLEPVMEVFSTEEAARKHLHDFVHGDEGEHEYAEKRGWTIECDDPDHFRAFEEGYYAGNHTEATIEEKEVK